MVTKKKAAPKKKAKAAKKASNVEKLQKGGIVAKGHQLSASESALLEKLSATEVNALIAAKGKLGKAFIDKHAKPSMDYAF